MIGAKISFQGFLRDQGGSILPMAAIAIVMSAALVGGGIDMSRAYRVQNRLQSACDASVLAGRRAVATNGYDTTAKGKATNYFNTNFDDSKMETASTVFTSSSSDNGGTVTGNASTELNLAVMKMFGYQKFNIAVSCQATMGVGNSDVMMVLDTTGSMGSTMGSGTRITALRAAMKNFYTTVKTATTGTNARVRYGFVPYSSTVNVGQLLLAANPAFLRDSYRVQSRGAETDGDTYTTNGSATNGSNQNDTSTSYGSSSSCSNDLGNTGWSNNGASTTRPTQITVDDDYGRQSWTTTERQPQRRTVYYECYKSGSSWYRRFYNQTRNSDTSQDWIMRYKPVTYDVSSYKTFASVTTSTGDFGASQTSSWNGCIEERATVVSSSFSYSTTLGLTPSGARDLDIDSAPTSALETQWSATWPAVAYYRVSSSGSASSSSTTRGRQRSACPVAAQLFAEMTQTEFNAYADSLRAEGNTYLDIGMAWGGRLSSPTGIFADNVTTPPNNGGEVSRHLIFMTDGFMEPNNNVLSAWGIEFHDRRTTNSGDDNDATGVKHSSRFRAVCEAIKAKGIRIWAIAFTSGSSASADLTACSSPNSYFNADDSAELNSAFQEIAKQVGELRISQ